MYSRDWETEVDEAALNQTDRLGLAFCRLNSWRWDELIGPKPEGFDELPNYDPKQGWLFHKKIRTKSDYIDPAIAGIESMIGSANTSRCWWKFVLGETEEAWFRWYTGKR